MANRRTIPWSAAMRDMRNERVRRAGVREERLRATSGLKGAINLSSWRGRSGRRYVVGVHPLSETDILDVTEAIVIAVRRDDKGVACLIDMTTVGPKPRERLGKSWLASARARGATEMHVHRLAESPEARAAIIDDLREDACA
jgi:hypothetical protein